MILGTVIPGGVEAANLLISSVVGAVFKLIANAQEIKAEQHRHMVETSKLAGEAVDKARAYDNKRVSFVRRLLALTVCFSVILLPKLVIVIAMLLERDITVSVSYSLFDPGGFFTQDREIVKWLVSDGLTITPLDNMAMCSILGFFFGSEIVKRR